MNKIENVMNKYLLASSDLEGETGGELCGWTKTPMKYQGEGPMRRQRLTDKSDRVALEIRHWYLREVAGKFQRWLREISSSKYQYRYLWKESEDLLPMEDYGRLAVVGGAALSKICYSEEKPGVVRYRKESPSYWWR